MWKFQQRDKKLKSKKSNMPKHGKNLGQVYKNAVNNRKDRDNRRNMKQGD